MSAPELYGPVDPLDDLLVAEAIQFLRAHSNVYQTLGTHRRLTQANRDGKAVKNFEAAADAFAALRPHAEAIKQWVLSGQKDPSHGN